MADLNNRHGIVGTADLSDMIKEFKQAAEEAKKAKQETEALGKAVDEIGKKQFNLTPKIALELDNKSVKAVESVAKQIQGRIDKAFKKYRVSATLALPETITSSSQKRKLNDLMINAKSLGYTGQALDAINLKYQEIIKTVAALTAENNSLKESLSSIKTEQDVLNYFDRLNKYYNTRKKLGDLNSELPKNLKLTDSYKSFGELADLPELERYLARHKKMVTDAIYQNTGFVDSINQIVAAGKEVKNADLSSIVNSVLITDSTKLLGKARQEINKYAVDTETALKKIKNLVTRYEHDKLSDQGAKDIAGYYTSYLKQGGAPRKNIENVIEDLSTYTIDPGSEGYSKVEHTKAQKVLAIQEAVKEGILAQIAEQQKLNDIKVSTYTIEELNNKPLEERLALLKDMKKAATEWNRIDTAYAEVPGNWLDDLALSSKMTDLESKFNPYIITVKYGDGSEGKFDTAFGTPDYDWESANKQFRKQIDLRKKILDIKFAEVTADEIAKKQEAERIRQQEEYERINRANTKTVSGINDYLNSPSYNSLYKAWESVRDQYGLDIAQVFFDHLREDSQRLLSSDDLKKVQELGSEFIVKSLENYAKNLSGDKFFNIPEIKESSDATKESIVLEQKLKDAVDATTKARLIQRQETKAIEQAHARMIAEQREWDRASINRTLTGSYLGNDPIESTRTVLSQLKDAHEAYDLSIQNNWNWERQYEWAVRFTSLYEQYAGRDNGTAKSLAKHTELYNQLLPNIETYKADLQAVLDFKPATPLPVAEAQKGIAEATEKATAAIERQQKIAANAPIASTKVSNAAIYQNAWIESTGGIITAKDLLPSKKDLTNAQAILDQAKSSVKAYADAAIANFNKISTKSLGNIAPNKLKKTKFNIPSNYILNQSGDVSQDDESWKYLIKLNEFQKQTVRNAQDQDGQWHVIFSNIFTDFKQLSSEITTLDTAILKTQNDLNNLGKTKIGKFQDRAPLLAQIAADKQKRDALVTMAQNVGADPAYAADYWQFVKDRQENTAQVKRDLAIANSKQDAKIALEAANTAKKIADDAVKKIATANAKLASIKQTIKTIQAGYTSGKSMIPDEEVRNLLDTEATDIKSYIDSFIGKGLKQNDIFAIEDKINSLKQSVESFRLDPKLASDKLKLTSEIDGLLEKLKASKKPTGDFQRELEDIRKQLSTPLEKSVFSALKTDFERINNSIKTAEKFETKLKETTKAINDYRDGLAKSGELTKAIDDEIGKLRNQLSNIKTSSGIEAVNNGLKELKTNASTLPKTVVESFNVMLYKMYELTDALNKIKELQALQATDPTISYKSQITGAQKTARQLQDELSAMKPESFMQKNIQQISQVQIDEYKQLKEEARQTAEAIGSIGSNVGGFSGGNNPPNKIEQLKKALKDLYNEQLNLTKLSNGKILNTEAIAQSENKIKSLTSTVSNLRKEVEQTYGANVADTIVKDVNQQYSTKFTSAFGKTLQDYVGSIEKFKAQFTSDQHGDFGKMIAKNMQPQIDEIQQLAKTYEILEQQIKTTANVVDLTNLNQQKQILGEQITTRIDNLENLSFSSLFKQLEKLGSFANTSGKIGAYSQKLRDLHQELALLANEKLSGNLSKDYTERFHKLLNNIAHFTSTADLWNLNQKNGVLNLGVTNIKDVDDLSAAMGEYAQAQNLVIDNNKQIDKDYKNQTVTQYYRNQNKELIQLTGSLKENMGYVKQVSLGQTGLLGDWGAAFGSFAKQLASYYTGYQAFTRIIGQAREGLNVLKQYDAALTDMSYSMNVTEKDLDKLGSSAVEMAKDLSTSLEDTLGIYQIYANMNTSIKEIEDTAKPTAILSNLGGIDALQASDQIQGVLQQFNMIEEGGANAAEASMHVVDVFDNIASNVSIDYVKGMQTISEAVTATGSVAYDAGMSFEQLAAVTAKVAERTREDGSTIGNAIKTIVTRISKVGKMPAYADEVSNEELSKASEALNEIGIAVYNTDGSFRELDVILTELRDKWDGLTDAQQANLSFQIAATRQTSKFKNILESWTEAMSIADAASVTSGNAEANQEKYEESVNGKLQKISTQWDAFWLSVYDSKTTDFVLDFLIQLTGGIDNLAQSLGGGLTAATLFFNLFAIKGKLLKKGALSQPKTWLQTYIIIIKWAYYHKEYCIMAQ